MATNKKIAQTAVKAGAMVGKRTVASTDKKQNVQKNIQSAKGNTSNAYTPQHKLNKAAHAGSEATWSLTSGKADKYWESTHNADGSKKVVGDASKSIIGKENKERVSAPDWQKRTNAGKKQSEARRKQTEARQKLLDLNDYAKMSDPFPVEYGYKEDKESKIRRDAKATAKTANNAGAYGAIAPFLPALKAEQERQANELREAQKSGNTRLKYNGRGDETYTAEPVMDGAQKHWSVKRQGGINLDYLSDYSDADLQKALGDYQLNESFINDVLKSGKVKTADGKTVYTTPEDYNTYNAIWSLNIYFTNA